MTAQLLPEALGLAVGILVYSLLCIALGLLTAWLVWVHDEGRSYVFLLAIFTTVGGVASIAQQIHTIVRWRDIKLEQHRHTVANVGNPEIALAGGSVNLDLALFYIQFACYGIEALLIFFWCAVLLQSVYQLRALVNTLRYSNAVAKATAVLFPVVMICLLRIDAVQDNKIAFFVIANMCMSIGLVGGAAMLLAILGQYIYTRRALVSFRFRYGKPSNKYGGQSRASTTTELQPTHNIYDRWFILRLAVGFVALGIFQLVTIMTEVTSQGKNNRSNLGDAADLSLQKAKSDFVFFLPGATPPLVTFIVFGTTRPFREYLWAACMPVGSRRRLSTRESRTEDDTSPRHGSQPRDLHVYNLDGGFDHSESSSMGSGLMLSSFAGRREEDVVPILDGSTHEGKYDRFLGDSEIPQSV